MGASKRDYEAQQERALAITSEQERAAAHVPVVGTSRETTDLLGDLLLKPIKFSADDSQTIRDTCCSGASKAEADDLIKVAEARGLHPLLGECHFVKRWDSAKRREVWSVQISIDGMRGKAEDTGLYCGQDEPEYEYNEDGSLKLARVRIYRRDWPRPCVGVARYAEFVQMNKEGRPTSFWSKMPHNQLSKCAEALGFRKAFPKRFARLYTPDEMAQAENDTRPSHDPETGEVHETKSKPVDWAGLVAACVTLDELREVFDSAKKAKAPRAVADMVQKRKQEIAAASMVEERQPGDDTEEEPS